MKTKKPKFKRFDVKIDRSLDKYDDVVLSPEKLKKANETLARLGVPTLPDEATNEDS